MVVTIILITIVQRKNLCRGANFANLPKIPKPCNQSKTFVLSKMKFSQSKQFPLFEKDSQFQQQFLAPFKAEIQVDSEKLVHLPKTPK